MRRPINTHAACSSSTRCRWPAPTRSTSACWKSRSRKEWSFRMKAAVVREHGGPDRLNYETDFPDPAPREGDVIVAVKASSLNYHDVFTRRGMPGIKVPMPAIMGLDVAGEIAEAGPGVSGWKRGDRVLVDPINRVEGGLMGETVHGGLAELCKARAYQLYGKPTRRGGGTDRGLDVVVNYTGGDTWVKSLKVLKVGGRLLTCGATAGFDPKEDIRFIWTFELKVLGSNGWARSDIETLLKLVQEGKLKVLVAK